MLQKLLLLSLLRFLSQNSVELEERFTLVFPSTSSCLWVMPLLEHYERPWRNAMSVCTLWHTRRYIRIHTRTVGAKSYLELRSPALHGIPSSIVLQREVFSRRFSFYYQGEGIITFAAEGVEFLTRISHSRWELFSNVYSSPSSSQREYNIVFYRDDFSSFHETEFKGVLSASTVILQSSSSFVSEEMMMMLEQQNVRNQNIIKGPEKGVIDCVVGIVFSVVSQERRHETWNSNCKDFLRQDNRVWVIACDSWEWYVGDDDENDANSWDVFSLFKFYSTFSYSLSSHSFKERAT